MGWHALTRSVRALARRDLNIVAFVVVAGAAWSQALLSLALRRHRRAPGRSADRRLPYQGPTKSVTFLSKSPNVLVHDASEDPVYWLVASDGGIFSYGDTVLRLDRWRRRSNKPIVGMAATPSGHGYWLVASDGGIFNYGDASSTARPVVAPRTSPSSAWRQRRRGGYWLVASDGGIFSYGDAIVLRLDGGSPSTSPSSAWRQRRRGTVTGSSPPTGASSTTATRRSTARRVAIRLNKPIVGMAATPSGHGYWLVASDGGIFNYGDASFYGSTGGPAQQAHRRHGGNAVGAGYWLVASDGGIFNYGDAVFYGSTGGSPPTSPSSAWRPWRLRVWPPLPAPTSLLHEPLSRLPLGASRAGPRESCTTIVCELRAGTAPYTWALTLGSLPDGLTLSSSGNISGTPT